MNRQSDIIICPICGLDLEEPAILKNFDQWLAVSCTNCGRFVISSQDFYGFNMEIKGGLNLKKLAFYLKDHKLKAESFEDVIHKDDLKKLEEKSKFPLSIKDSVNEIIIFLNKYKLEEYPLTTKNMFLFGIDSEYNLNQFIKYSESKKILEFKAKSFDNPYGYVSLSVVGIEIAENLQENIFENKVFIAMWFDEKMMPVYINTIKEVVTSLGYKPIRIDEKEYNNKIDDEILKEIDECKFMIADFTGHRGGVYFEAGYAIGKGKEVIFTCRADDRQEVHFDTNHYNYIFWKDEKDLKARLTKRISESIQ